MATNIYTIDGSLSMNFFKKQSGGDWQNVVQQTATQAIMVTVEHSDFLFATFLAYFRH